MYFKKFVFLYSVFIFIIFSFFIPSKIFAYTEVSSDIVENTTWTLSESPYFISNDLFVEDGVTLNIDPGVVVKFDYNNILVVDGVLIADGTIDNKIYFTSIYDDSVGGDTNGDGENSEPWKGDWNSILIRNSEASSIFNNVVLNYSNNGIFLNDGGLLNINNFNSDQGFIFDNSKGYLKNINAKTFELYNGSEVDIEDSIFYQEEINMSNFISGGSSLTLKNSELYNETNQVLSIYSNSSVNAENVEIVSNGNSFIPIISVYSDSYLSMNDSLVSGYNGLESYFDSTVIIDNSDFLCENDGLSIYNSSILSFSNSSVESLHDGFLLFGEVEVTIQNSKISGAGDVGLLIFNNTNLEAVKLLKNEIFNNEYGIVAFKTTVNASQNSIHDNIIGVFTPVLISLDFRNNWWGDASGPYHPVLNSEGLGDIVSDNILFDPWLTSDPLVPEISKPNVIFIPGFRGSRLYTERSFSNSEDQLWEANNNQDMRDMYMDSSGNSLDSGIYTKDIIKKTNLPVVVYDIYESFENSMNDLVSNGEISSFKALPYDWRYSADDVINRGVKKIDGTISYIDQVPEGQLPYMLKEIEDTINNSNGKITIITHSNGGLVAKALIKKLQQMKDDGENNWIDSIDNLIMVAPPQIGTPKAIAALLHGYGESILKGFIIKKSVARDFGKNLPGAYGLLPSQAYFDTVTNPVIVFDPSLDKINNFRSVYGNDIDSVSELKDFLTGIDGRINLESSDTIHPSILNQALIDKATNLHDNIDNLEIPASIKVSQIAGWGNVTVSGVRYKVKDRCLLEDNIINSIWCNKNNSFDYEPIFTIDGDDTVVTPSVVSQNGENYYVNLFEYNKNNKDREHKDILEVDSINDLINNILNNNNLLPQYITKEKSINIDNLILSMHSPVSIDLYDEQGRHTGLLQNNDSDIYDISEEEIPNSSYLEFGEGKYIIVPKDGNYTLKLSGLDFGTFTLKEEVTENDKIVSNVSFTEVPTTASMEGEVSINQGSIGALSLDIDGNGIIDNTVNTGNEFDPVLYLKSLKQTIISLDFPKKIEKELLNRIDDLIKQINKGHIKNVDKKIYQIIKQFELKKDLVDKKDKHKNDDKKKKVKEKDEIKLGVKKLLDNLEKDNYEESKDRKNNH